MSKSNVGSQQWMKRSLMGVGCLSFVWSAFCAESEAWSLSLEEAVRLAMEHHPEIGLRRLNISKSKDLLDAQRGLFDPSFNGEISVYRDRSTQNNQGTGNRYQVENKDLAVEVGVTQNLPVGATIGLTSSLEKDDSSRTPEQQTLRLGLEYRQSLLQGFGTKIGLAELRKSKLDIDVSLAEWRGFAENFVATVEQAYWNLVLEQEKIKLAKSSLLLGEQQLEDVQYRVEAGSSPSVDLALAKAEVAQLKLDLVEIENSLGLRRLEFLSMFHVQDLQWDRSVELLTSIATPVVFMEQKLERLAMALAQRPELTESRLRMKQRRLETVVTENGLLPKLDFFADLGKSGYGNHAGQAFSDFSDRAYDVEFGLSFEWPLGKRAAKANHRIAQTGVEQMDLSIQNLERLVEKQWRMADRQMEGISAMVNVVKPLVLAQREALEAEESRLEAGMGTLLKVLERRREVHRAELRETETLLAYRLALLGLFKAESSLLERHGLILTP